MSKEIILDRFKPRDYQIPVIQAIEEDGYKRLVLCWSRRMGKDHIAFYIAIRQMLRKVCTIFYIFPTFRQCKLALWDGINSDGQRIIEYIPPELIANKNDNEMKIRLKNGSLLQFVGSSDVDRVRGTACYGAIFSEYSRQDPQAWAVIRPILAQNDGWALFASTPNGKNDFYDLYNLSKEAPNWYSSFHTVNDVDYINKESLEQERKEMSEDKYQQEYECNFEIGTSGSFYSRYIDKLRLDGHIGNVPYDVGYKVHTFWDLGMRDSTCIIYAQVKRDQSIHIIDYYENNKEGLEHYAKVLDEKGYTYGRHIAPHDIMVKELGTGMTRLEKSRQLGINFVVAPNISIVDGIEAVRTNLGKMYFDSKKCKDLINSLENYRHEYDEKKQVYRDTPLHDKHSHASDAMRYLCISLSKVRDGMTAEDLKKLRTEAIYGQSTQLPEMFR